MSITSDPNELQPLSELANRTVQERVQRIPEFATSSRWGASAVVLQLSEGNGFEATAIFTLRTPLGEPFEDIVTGWGGNREQAALAAAEEWLHLALPAALAVHSDKDVHARLGETAREGRVYTWRLASGEVAAVGPDGDEVIAELGRHALFDRLEMARVLPLEREVPWLCLKLRLTRTAQGAARQSCRLNNAEWPAGVELLQRFNLPGRKPLDVKQYLFLRRTGVRAAARPAAAGGGKPAAPATGGAEAGKKPWWKVW